MMASCVTCSRKILFEDLRVHLPHIQSVMRSAQTVRPHMQKPCYLTQRGFCENTEQRIKDMGKVSFWNKFYGEKKQQKKMFDWFFEYKDIKNAMKGIIETLYEQKPQRALKVLDVGCGTSSMALEIAYEYRDLASVWCMDFSSVALQELRSQQDIQPKDHLSKNVDYLVADAMNLPFKDESFDLILEKGTLDAMLKTQLLSQRAPYFVAEVVRVLDRHGIYCQFSDEDPELRLPILEEAKRNLQMLLRCEISVSYRNLFSESSINYFMYCISHKTVSKPRN